MSILSYGQRCVIVGGCPENIGLIVMVIQRLGAYQGREDAYWIRTVKLLVMALLLVVQLMLTLYSS